MFLASKRRLALALSAAAVALAPAAALAGTVVASSGPSAAQFRVGSQVSDTQPITLRQGDSLTVLVDGRTRVLRGPGSVVLAQQGGAASGDSRALAALTTRRSAGRARTGAVRTGDDGQGPRNPNLWYVDIARSGNVCLADADRINLWRADTTAEAVYAIAPAGSAEDAVTVSFPEREMLARWDAAVQIREGVTYTIGTTPQDSAAQISFVFLEEVPEDAEGLAQVLIANECMAQLEQMTSALAEG